MKLLKGKVMNKLQNVMINGKWIINYLYNQ